MHNKNKIKFSQLINISKWKTKGCKFGKIENVALQSSI
jgi:hypothetical protein